MELKKNPNADINKKSRPLLMMGLMASLAIVLVSFQWKEFDPRPEESVDRTELDDEEEFVPPSEQIKPPPPPPPEPQVVTVIEIIDDDSEEEETIEEVALEVDEDTEIEVVDFQEEEEAEEEILMSAEVMPEFPGGFGAFGKYLQKNIKYPDLAMETNTQGKVYVKFLVRKDGSTDKVSIVRGIGAGCDEEAVRVIKSVPKWSPGMQMGKPVNVWYTLPVNFQLE